MGTRGFDVLSFPMGLGGDGFSRKPRQLVRVNCSRKDAGEENKEASRRQPSFLDALDFSQVRSDKDAELLEEAREATRSGGRMTRDQYKALRRKIGGTYKDFFKSYIDVEGQYVEEGWVDKKCRVCNRNTDGQPRQVDKFGRYVHVACLDPENNARPTSSNFFVRLFSQS